MKKRRCVRALGAFEEIGFFLWLPGEHYYICEMHAMHAARTQKRCR
jgi:hypothetical protein